MVAVTVVAVCSSEKWSGSAFTLKADSKDFIIIRCRLQEKKAPKKANEQP